MNSIIHAALMVAWLTAWASFLIASWVWAWKADNLISMLFWLGVNLALLILAGLLFWYEKQEK